MTTFAVWKTNAKCGQLLQLPDELDSKLQISCEFTWQQWQC